MRDEKTHWADGIQTEIGSGQRFRWRVNQGVTGQIVIRLDRVYVNGVSNTERDIVIHDRNDARWIRDTLTEFIDDIHDIEALKDEVAQLRHDRDDVAGLRQALDDALGPHCSSCGNPIDPGICHCGENRDNHHGSEWEGHSFCPMGCVCGYEPDWPQLAKNLRERLWFVQKQNSTMLPVFDAALRQHEEHAKAPERGFYLDATKVIEAVDDFVKREMRLQHKAIPKP